MSLPVHSQSKAPLVDLCAEVPTLLTSVRDAWATWQEAASNAHLAAVMGYTLPRLSVDHSNPELTLDEDSDYQEALRSATTLADPRDAHTLHLAVVDHIRWLTTELESGLVRDIEAVTGIDVLDEAASKAAEIAARESFEELEGSLKEKIAEIESESKSLYNQNRPGMSTKRREVIATYDSQQAFILECATDLAFTDQAEKDVTKRIAELKSSWLASGREAREFFQSKRYTKLLNERKNIKGERVHSELSLQSYFDHHAHGASRTESAKADKKALRLADKITEGGSGYKQIQLIDMYCLSRGNEAWAIIPDLIRIGHDIDPIECIHYKPPTLDNTPPQIKPYRDEQNRAFAKQLLNLCDPGLRAKLLARHQFGVNKVESKVNESDGCGLYWTLLQLYHPLSRQHRRTLERELYAFPPKFATGDPKATLTRMQRKHQEALDVALKLRWDSIGIPLIDVLSTRDPLFAVELSSFRDLPEDPDDSAVVLDQLLAKVSHVIEVLDTANKDWEGRSAKVAKSDSSQLAKAMKQIAELKKAMRADTPHNPGSRTKPLNTTNTKPGYCHVVKCNNKVQGYTSTNGWKVCGTCLLHLRSTNVPLKLKEGGTWGTAKLANSQMKVRVGAGANEGLPSLKALKAHANRKRKREKDRAAKAALDKDKDEGSESDEEAPQAKRASNPGPAETLFNSLKKGRKAKAAKKPSERKGSH